MVSIKDYEAFLSLESFQVKGCVIRWSALPASYYESGMFPWCGENLRLSLRKAILHGHHVSIRNSASEIYVHAERFYAFIMVLLQSQAARSTVCHSATARNELSHLELLIFQFSL
jgi:hypothetical protein